MKNREILHRTILLVVFSVLLGCENKRELNGYKVVAPHSELYSVSKGPFILVGPKITQWGVWDRFLLVYKESYKTANYPNVPYTQETGYAIIDTKNDETYFYPSIFEFAEAAKVLGIPDPEKQLEPTVGGRIRFF